ncbi:Pleiotropic drug resistance protein 2 [Glycine soja]
MNAKRRENMVGVLPKRRILMRHGKSQGNWDTTTYTNVPDHNIQSTAQGMTQILRAGEHLCCVMDSAILHVPLRLHSLDAPRAQTMFLEEEDHRVREELQVRKRDLGNFQVKERMNEISMTVFRLPVFYKQRDFRFYPAWAFGLPIWLLRIPLYIMELGIWIAHTYYTIGFAPSASRTLVVANTLGTLFLQLVFVLGGFVIAKDDIEPWMIWGYYI